jgi:hypothetical protein
MRLTIPTSEGVGRIDSSVPKLRLTHCRSIVTQQGPTVESMRQSLASVGKLEALGRSIS